MIVENVICTARMLAGYFLLCFVWPSFFLKPFVKGKGLGYRLLFYEVIANMYICLVSYILAYAKIYYWWTLALFVVVLPVAVRVYVEREWVKEKRAKLWSVFCGVRDGWYGARVARRKIFRFFKKYLRIFWKNYVKKYWREWIALALLAAFVILYLEQNRYSSATYFASDEEVHMYWLTCMLHNQPFPSGLYPHAYHMIIGAICSLFGISAIRGYLCFVAVSATMVFSHFYFLLRKVFPSYAAGFSAMGFYLLSNFFLYDTYARFLASITMDFGLAAFATMFAALLYYVKEREKTSWWLFVLAVAWTVQIHFYITIYAVCICVAFAVVFFVTMLRKKIFHKILLGGTLGVVLAAVLFVPGLLLGYKFENSMRWALGVITESSSSDETAETETEDVTESENVVETEDAAGEEAIAGTENTGDSGQGTETGLSDETGETTAVAQQETTLTLTEVKEKLEVFYENLQVWMGTFVVNGDSSLLIERDESDTWGKQNIKAGVDLLLVLTAVLFVYGVGICLISLLRRKKDTFYRGQIYIFFSFGWLVSLFLYITYYIGLPELIQRGRMVEFLALFSVFPFAIPMQVATDVLSKIPGIRRCQAVLTMAATVLGLGMVYKTGQIKTLEEFASSVIMEGDARLCMNLLANKEDHTWTVISKTNDLTLVRFDGYHTEIIDLLEDIEKKEELYIPTADVYVVTDKTYWDAEKAQLSMSQVNIGGVSDRGDWYTYYPEVIQSKLNFLMEKLLEIYPSEVSVYYEDDECVVYYIKQDPYFLLNLAVDYSDKIEEALQASE